MKPWILIDVSSLCYRFFHVMGDLTYGTIKTGVIYGFIRHVIELQDWFRTKQIAFCFDAGCAKRVALFDGYKATRRAARATALENRDSDDPRVHLELQIEYLRIRYLPTIGYRNIFQEPGFEADDLIAKLSRQVESAIVVSGDHDLFQLISPTVRMWRPSRNRMLTLARFRDQYGIDPSEWWKIKSLTGCDTDEVPGVPGVGEKTAIKYLRGELSEKSKIYKRIKQSRALLNQNAKLVRLPFEGTPSLKLRQDEPSMKGWEKVCTHLGFKSLRYDQIPPFLRS